MTYCWPDSDITILAESSIFLLQETQTFERFCGKNIHFTYHLTSYT
jgi:hypothetical protein